MTIKTRSANLGMDARIDTTKLIAASRLVAKLSGMQPQWTKSIVGQNAFAHGGGIHQDGVLKDARTYEIMTPQSVGVPGNNLVLGKHSGRHALGKRLAELGYTASKTELEAVYENFMKLAESKKNIYDQDLLSLLPPAARPKPVARVAG